MVNSGLNIMLISLLTFSNGFLYIFSLKLYVIFLCGQRRLLPLRICVRNWRQLFVAAADWRKELLKSRLIVPTVNFIFNFFLSYLDFLHTVFSWIIILKNSRKKSYTSGATGTHTLGARRSYQIEINILQQ